jgi:ribosomal protein S18 acetylase RimI-like enzyme
MSVRIIIKDIDKNIICGFLTYLINKDEPNIGTINYISVNQDQRGKGIGTKLLWTLYDYIKMDKKIKYVIWDDCSDYYRQKDNIYLKIGAKYINKNGPEMIWKINYKTVREKRKKYSQNIQNIQKINDKYDIIINYI